MASHPSGCWSGGCLLAHPPVHPLYCAEFPRETGRLHWRCHQEGQNCSPQEYGQDFLPSPLTQQLNTGHTFCLRVSGNDFQRSLDWENQTPVEVSLHLVREDLFPFHQDSCLEHVFCKSSPAKADNVIKLSEIIISQVKVIHTESLLFNSSAIFGVMNSQHTAVIVRQLHLNHVIARCSNGNWQLTCTKSVTYHGLKLRELCDKIKYLHASRQKLWF